MRINRLKIQNFKGFKEFALDLQPHFNVLVGENGSGKTSVLDALAVALGLWHKHIPGHGWRNILPEEIHVEPRQAGDRITFEPVLPVRIEASGSIMDAATNVTWTRMIREGGTRTTNAEANEAEKAIAVLIEMAKQDKTVLPVLAYYGAGRAWLPTNRRPPSTLPMLGQKSSRFNAYHNCLDTRIRDQDLNHWFLLETAARVQNGGDRPGFQAVKAAVLKCIPGADALRYDADRKEIVLSIGGHEQSFYNLSAGQRMMLALVADIAIKAITLNSYLFSSRMLTSTDPISLLEMTTGMVLIDEVDVHLHPTWQRRVVNDLKTVFKSIQFVCTTHSPQVIGEVPRDQVMILDANGPHAPSVAYGADSNWILEHVLGTPVRSAEIEQLIRLVEDALEEGNLDEAREKLSDLRQRMGAEDGEIVRLESSVSSMESSSSSEDD